MISVEGKEYPCEIKGISQFDWDKIDSAEDMIHSKKPWLRKYPAQLQVYLFLTAKERGLFYILNKATFRPKAIWMELDYIFVDSLLKKAQRVNAHVAAKTLPDRCEDVNECLECPFAHECLPDLNSGEGVKVIDDVELEANIDRLEELNPLIKEAEDRGEYIKKIVEGKDKLSVGKYFITGKYTEFDREATPATHVKFWRLKIVKIKGLT
jgi:hypothetical protein